MTDIDTDPLCARLRTAYRGLGLATLVGSPRAVRAGRRTRRGATAARGLEWVRAHVELPDEQDAPVLLASPSWRSGSTLLQRLVNSTGRHMVWGEPYAHCHLVESLAAGLRPFGDGYPRVGDVWSDGGPGVLDGTAWTANLSPDRDAWFLAQRRLLQTAFEVPDGAGQLQWGVKSVRYGADELRLLRWLFPRATVVVLVRRPTDAWASYAGSGAWFEHYPDRQVRTDLQFGRMWSRRATELAQLVDDGTAHLLRYEDLSTSLDDLDAWLGAPVDRSVLEHRVAGFNRRSTRSTRDAESVVVQRMTHRAAARFGY